MKHPVFIIYLASAVTLSSCLLKSKITAKLNGLTNQSAIASSSSPAQVFKDIQKIITIPYSDSDSDSDLATACSVSNLINITVSTPCACDSSGICTVKIIGNSGYYGPAGLDYFVETAGVESNTATASFNIGTIGASTSEDWIKIPANAGGMGLDAFYVMKYEAKAWTDGGGLNGAIDGGEVDTDGCNETLCTTANWGLTNLPVSTPNNRPWRMISATNAEARCIALGPGHRLISNPEWMAIARDIEVQGNNWTGDSIGTGCLFKGNTNISTVGDGNSLGDSCAYNGASPEQGIGRDIRAKHILSNGSEIYDLSGNVWEWVDWDKETAGYQIGPTTCPNIGYQEFSTIVCPDLNDSDFQTQNGGYSSTEGVGRFVGGTNAAAIRGGPYTIDSHSGVFSLNFLNPPSDTFAVVGFRCVYVP
jgi:formylglycine-generating enzyme required for sulfatase activity